MPLFHRNSLSRSPERSIEDPNQHRSSRFLGRGSSRRHRRESSLSHSSSSSRDSGTTRPHHSIFRNHHPHDPSITAARDRVYRAEAAERAADKALAESQRAVHEAREHVKRLEREAKEDARLAKLKQSEAKDISKRAKPLGRYT